MEGCDNFIMATITKINDTTVAKVGTQEIRQVFSLADLNMRKTRLETQLADIDELIAAFD